MKWTFLIASFFLCSSVCLTALEFPGGHGIAPAGTKFHRKKALADGAFNIFPSGRPTIDTNFGPSGQVCSGVDIHFVTGHEKDLDMIAAAGFKFIRMDILWQDTELTRGTYHWSAYDELTANLEKHGLRAIFILCYSNSLYEDTVDFKVPETGKEDKGIASPHHPESVEAFARWSAAAAEHFKTNNIVWEIWNEPNVTYWRPMPDIKQYIALALAASRAIKDLAPEAVIIGPSTSQVPFPFLESFLASGVLEYLDGVSVHPYRPYSNSPETAGADYQKLREMIDHYAPAGKKGLPIISSEWGYASATKGISLEKQAEFIVRMQLSNLLNDIPLSIWYDWKNDGISPTDFEHNCGTVTYDLELKPAYTAIQVMSQQLEGFTLMRRLDVKNDDDYAVVFRSGKDEYKIAAWTTGLEHEVIIENEISDAKHTAGINGTGHEIKIKTEKGYLALELEGLPQYIKLRGSIRLD